MFDDLFTIEELAAYLQVPVDSLIESPEPGRHRGPHQSVPREGRGGGAKGDYTNRPGSLWRSRWPRD